MKSIFRTASYLRSNYVNKEGKTPVMLRIYLNNERLCIGSAGIAVGQNQWDSTRERVKGRNTEALSMNLQLDSIQNDLQTIYRKLEMTDDLCLERIKSEYLGRQDNVCTWKGHSTLTPLGKQDLLTLVTILLPLVKSWCRGQFYFTLLDTLAFLSP